MTTDNATRLAYIAHLACGRRYQGYTRAGIEHPWRSLATVDYRDTWTPPYAHPGEE